MTRGVRLAAVAWIQSRVRGEAEREILREVRDLATWAEKTAPEAPETLRLHRLRGELLRRWMD